MSTIVNYTYWKWDSVLAPELCNALLAEVDWATAEPGAVDGKNVPADPSLRVTDVIFQNPMKTLGCIARSYIETANHAANWNFVLNLQEDTQLSRYKSIDQGHYDWHMDAGPPQNGAQRKLTCVILLSDASTFEGGILQLRGMEDKILLEKQGSIIVFPSFIEHKVTPVTKGVRHTAVTWAVGPAFK